jgi:hypothetical protein
VSIFTHYYVHNNSVTYVDHRHRKTRGNKKEIKNFIENKYVKQKVKNRGG